MSIDSLADYVTFLTVSFNREDAADLFAEELKKEGYWVSKHDKPSGNPPQWTVHAAPTLGGKQ